jgi:hypothetical protein
MQKPCIQFAQEASMRNDGTMLPPMEIPPASRHVFETLSGAGDLWLWEVPNNGPRRRRLYDRFAGIRRTGVYLIRDVGGAQNVFYVGKVVQDPLDPMTINPNADGIIGRLSGHQNMSGSNVLARWYQLAHPDVQVPKKVMAGALRDRIQTEAAPRMRVAYCTCPPALATVVERHVIRYGPPDAGVPPLLNSPNWKDIR